MQDFPDDGVETEILKFLQHVTWYNRMQLQANLYRQPAN